MISGGVITELTAAGPAPRRVQWTTTITDAAKQQILGTTFSRIFRKGRFPE